MSAFNLTPTIIEGGNFNAKMGVVNANSDNYNKLKNKPSINGVELVGDKTNEDIGAISAPKTAKVGQTIKVKLVDENNHPTEWESVDLPKPLPTPADGDSGKVPMVQDDLSYALEKVSGSGIDLTGAGVGQIAKITAVDDNGKPTAWEAIDLPNGLPAVTTEDAGKVPVVLEDGSYGLANIKDVPVYLGTIPVSPDTALYLVAPVKDYKKVIIVKERASQSTGLTSYLYAGLYQPETKKRVNLAATNKTGYSFVVCKLECVSNDFVEGEIVYANSYNAAQAAVGLIPHSSVFSNSMANQYMPVDIDSYYYEFYVANASLAFDGSETVHVWGWKR